MPEVKLHCGDCLDWLKSLPSDSASLVFGSPPYEVARTYSIGFNLKGQAWVDWMVEIYRESARVSIGLVAFVVEGQTKNYRWSATPALLMADLHRAGFNLRKPPAYARAGIAGSGGPDWLKNDYEFAVCISRKGRLPWSDPTACGKPPKYGPGGVMSYRVKDGTRVNERKMRELVKTEGISQREAARQVCLPLKTTTMTSTKDDTVTGKSYIPPELANPGNIIKCAVGGGKMGHPLAHETEAAFPLKLAEFFVRSFCPPEEVCVDPFLGSGTTAHACVEWNRRFWGCDIRQNQIDLTNRRLRSLTPRFPETA